MIGGITGTAFADILSFRNGVGGYHSQIDLGMLNSDLNNHYASGGVRTDGTLGIDGDAVSQSVLRFEDIIGSGAGQIATGSTIQSATLTLYTRGATSTDPGSAGKISAYRLTTFWDTNSDWRTFNAGNWGGSDGVTDDGVLVSTRTSGVSNSNHAPNDIDLTAAVQFWANGGSNYGIGLAFPHTNAADLASGNESIIAEAYRPLLTVDYTIPEPGTLALMSHWGLALLVWAAVSKAGIKRVRPEWQ
jgi:hypothetical protein